MEDNQNRLAAILDTVRLGERPARRSRSLSGRLARPKHRAPGLGIDLVVLTVAPDRFRDAAWLRGIDWLRAGLHPTHYADERYGVVWSRRVWFEPKCEVEFAFASISWAATSPVDSGTRGVVVQCCRVLYDPDGLLERLIMAVASTRDATT